MEQESTPLLGKPDATAVSPSKKMTTQVPKITVTDTAANALGYTGRIILGISLVGFTVAAIAEVSFPVAGVVLGLMVLGAGLSIAGEIKKECSRSATAFRENRERSAEQATAVPAKESNEAEAATVAAVV